MFFIVFYFPNVYTVRGGCVSIAGSIFEVLVVWLIVASGEGSWHLLSGQRTAERTRTSGRRAIHANFRAPRFVSFGPGFVLLRVFSYISKRH